MKKLILLLASGLCLATLHAADRPLLVSPQWLHEHLNDPDLVVLQVSFLQLDYDNEHIPGARYLWPEWLCPNTPEANYNLPDAKTAQAVLRRLGISRKSHIVLYHIRSEVPVTARMFLTLEALGLSGRVSYLNGGLPAWKKAGYTVTRDAPVFRKGNVRVQPARVIVDKDYVLKALRSDSIAVVDARIKRYYDGDATGNPRDGHITGALNIPFPEMSDSTNAFKPVGELSPYFTQVGPPAEKEIVLYCFIGQTASVVYIAARLLGYRVKLYDHSLQEWSRREELPMEKSR